MTTDAPKRTCDACPICAGCRVGHVHCRPCHCAEAVAAERARIRAEVRGLHRHVPIDPLRLPSPCLKCGLMRDAPHFSLAAVLAIVDPRP